MFDRECPNCGTPSLGKACAYCGEFLISPGDGLTYELPLSDESYARQRDFWASFQHARNLARITGLR